MPPHTLDPGRPAARFVVGIDLGTTNSAVAFVDTQEDASPVRTFPIPQLAAPGEIEARDTLPSFHYEPVPGQFGATALRLPWEEEGSQPSAGCILGVLAREQGAEVPGRLIVSAKSWLSHAGVDRTAELLPWHGAPEVKKLSPVEVSARFLGHLRAAWNFRQPAHPLEAQEVIVTIPASFDETARELTLAAARRAGLPRVALLEEPQAAFYAWTGEHKVGLPRGAKILVCDIGGGTSDFTLIEALEPVGASGAAGAAAFRRFAVGDHLILGGDNLDLALARFAEERLGAPLHPRQWGALLRRCQHAKEILLGPNAPERLTLSVPAAGGARLIGGARQVDLERGEVVALLADGFLPRVALDAQPERRASGFQEFGLPYAPDPAITRYLAAFLSAHGETGKAVRPDAVLLNGGFFASPVLRERLLETLASWFEESGGQRKKGRGPLVLENQRLDLAVAAGAARFGLARRGVGTKIAGGLARSYYIGVGRGGEGHAAVCLAPAGLEEGREVDLKDRQFDLRLRQPVEFPLYVSSARPADQPGDLVALESGQLIPLPPLRTALRGRAEGEEAAPVHLHARLTEVGALEVWCEETAGKRRQWKLPFDVRAAARGNSEELRSGAAEPGGCVDEQTAHRCREMIREAFAGPSGAKDAALTEALVKRLEAASAMNRLEWPLSLLRGFWEELMAVESGRARSEAHEARWLNLLGFSLRPGYGFAVDDWRAGQTWRLFERKIVHPRNELCRAEWHILWRRIAGGLTAGQQRALAAPLLSEWKKADPHQQPGKSGGWGTHETAEIWRLLGSLEWLGADLKLDLGNRLFARWPEQGNQTGLARAALWTLGRLGARAPMYGPLNTVLPAEDAEQWIERLILLIPTDAEAAFTLVQMARRTGDRFRDISEDARTTVLRWLAAAKAPAHEIELVREGGALHIQERDAMFGESLPCGLRLIG